MPRKVVKKNPREMTTGQTPHDAIDDSHQNKKRQRQEYRTPGGSPEEGVPAPRAKANWAKGTSRSCPQCTFSTTHPPALARHIKMHQDAANPPSAREAPTIAANKCNQRHPAPAPLERDQSISRQRRADQQEGVDHLFAHKVGDEVEVCWGIGRWYPAKVVRAVLQGAIELFDVQYADGSKEHSTSLRNGVLRRPLAPRLISNAYLEDEQTNEQWLLKQGPNSVGRDAENDIQVNSKFVSHTHAVVFMNADNTCVVTDLGSSNKSWIRTTTGSKHMKLMPDIEYEVTTGFHFRVADVNMTLNLL